MHEIGFYWELGRVGTLDSICSNSVGYLSVTGFNQSPGYPLQSYIMVFGTQKTGCANILRLHYS